MCAVSTTQQANDWEIDFFSIFFGIAIIADRKFHFIRAVEFSRHAYTNGQLAVIVKFAASTEIGQNKVCFVCRDLCIYVYSV